MALTQNDFPAAWPDSGRPCPWSADAPNAWPVAVRTARGDVWQLAPDRFAVLASPNFRLEFPSLAEAVAFLS